MDSEARLGQLGWRLVFRAYGTLIGLARWWHLGVDVLWLLNGLVFYVLLFASGHWRRVVPTSWDVLPNALSVQIQDLSLQWPAEHGGSRNNSLQLIAYFITIFVAAPAALITGLGCRPRCRRVLGGSVACSASRPRVSSISLCVSLVPGFHRDARPVRVHDRSAREPQPHLRGRDDDSWIGLTVFALSMVVLIVGWVAATPLTLRYPRVVQRVGFALIGPVQGLFEHVDSTAGLYTERDISPYFWRNGKLPDSEKYAALLATNFAGCRLRIGGLVDNPVDLTLEELRALHHEQITQHFCIQGWSGVAKWGGVSMQTILDLVRPKPEAKWVVFYSFADGPEGNIYYDVHAIEQMRYKLTMLAYDMNGKPLPPDHGAPCGCATRRSSGSSR